MVDLSWKWASISYYFLSWSSPKIISSMKCKKLFILLPLLKQEKGIEIPNR